MNTVFIGTTYFGLKCLERILAIPNVNVTGVLTGKPSFRISYSEDKPVVNVLYADFKSFCVSSNIPCIELKSKMSNPEVIQAFRQWAPEFILVVGWYHIVPKEIRDMAKRGAVGLHASMLPNYRGGAPLVWALINGESETGISLFYLDDGVDTGNIISQRKIPIKLNDTIKTLYAKAEEEGINLLVENLPLIVENKQTVFQQPMPNAFHQKVWAQRSPDDGLINWNSSALELYNFIRAQTKPYPGAFTYLHGKKTTIWEGKLFDWIPKNGRGGEIIGVVREGPLKGILVATRCNDCSLLITDLSISGKNYTGIEFIEKGMASVGCVFGGRSK